METIYLKRSFLGSSPFEFVEVTLKGKNKFYCYNFKELRRNRELIWENNYIFTKDDVKKVNDVLSNKSESFIKFDKDKNSSDCIIFKNNQEFSITINGWELNKKQIKWFLDNLS